jgi:hypothetical protein
MRIPRRRWWLVGAFLVACLLLAGWWVQRIDRERDAREQFERIRIGMTSEEVATIIGSKPFSRAHPEDYLRAGTWEAIAADSLRVTVWMSGRSRDDVWNANGMYMCVAYTGDKLQSKMLARRVSDWELKLEQCLAWLRGVAGLPSPTGAKTGFTVPEPLSIPVR